MLRRYTEQWISIFSYPFGSGVGGIQGLSVGLLPEDFTVFVGGIQVGVSVGVSEGVTVEVGVYVAIEVGV